MTASRHFTQGIIALALGLPVLAGAQAQQSWVRNYNTPDNDFATGIVMDGQSNTCVIGTAGGDLLTIKYSSEGTELWSRRFGDLRDEAATAVAADSAGQVWVTGSAADSGIVTLKYGQTGALLWARRLDETNVFGGSLVRLAIDPTGNAYAAAGVRGEHIVIKYSPEGDQLWLRRFPIPNYFVHTTAVALDPLGNLIAAGDTIATGGVSAFFIVKYDSAGNFLWAKDEDWGGNNNIMTGMALDSTGRVHVTGSSFQGRHRFLTAAYSPSGELVWVASRQVANGYNAISRAIKVDGSGNVIITGYETQPVSEDDDSFEIVTVKYDPAGVELWSARSTFQRQPDRLVVDAAGNIYVGGCADCDTARKLLLLKYAPNGSQLWESTVPAVILKDFILDDSANVYVIDDNFGGGTGWAMETRKFVQISNPSQPDSVVSPARVEVFVGSSVTFMAVASGPGPFTYQWRRYGFTLPGQTNATLTLTNVQLAQQAFYTISVTNGAGYTISPEAQLIVLPQPRIKSIRRTGDHIVLVWDAAFPASVRLQSTASLSNPQWADVPGSAGQTTIELPVGSTQQYFRLITP